MYDLVIRGGAVALPDGAVRPLDIGVKDGKVECLSSGGLTGRETLNVSGLTVLPGAVDQHMHTFWGYDFESFENATKAAAMGGVTTVLDMPLDAPATLSAERFSAKVEMARKWAYVDFALYAGIDPLAPEVERLAGLGAVGFKLFMDGAAPPGMYPGLDTGQLLGAMRSIALTGVPAAIHAENSFIVDAESRRLQSAGRMDGKAWSEARPEVAEEEAVARALILARETRCPTSICHLSTPGSVAMVREARADGCSVYAETCPHYLLLTWEDSDRDVRVKYNPPARGRQSVEGLWRALEAGWIHAVASDHGPLTKDPAAGIWDCRPGAGDGVEVMVPLVLTEGLKRGLPPATLVNVLSSGPARTFGLYPKKGCLLPGSDADLCALDLKARRTIEAGRLSMLGEKWSPFEGWAVTAVPVFTVVRGNVVVRDGVFTGTPGAGRFIAGRATRARGATPGGESA
ncbi:MAG: amidohydrolase family protein [Firmicutes bacterium]|nr:amidohydrolase family protein [Bacillota bacterium]